MPKSNQTLEDKLNYKVTLYPKKGFINKSEWVLMN
jgi:hypothetical protein